MLWEVMLMVWNSSDADDLPNYVSYNSGLFSISRVIDGKDTYFGSYKSLDEVKRVLDYLDSVNWNVDKVEPVGKYIAKKRNGKFSIQKVINGEKVHCGVFDTLEEALNARDVMIESGWNLSVINRFRSIKNVEDRHIIKYVTKSGYTSYRIQKWLDGKLCSFGCFRSIGNARTERDLLEKYGWDYDLLLECE